MSWAVLEGLGDVSGPPGNVPEQSWAVWGRTWANLGQLGGFRNAPGKVSEAPRPYFSRFFLARALAMRKSSVCVKTTVFLKFLRFFYMSPALRASHKTTRDRSRTELATKIVLKIHRGARQAPFWKGMGVSWVPLERHLAGFGALLGVSWRFWGAS